MKARILFVCHGNICRSPMAEFVMKDMVAKRGLADEFYIESCAVTNEEIGNDIYPPAKEELRRRGIPFTRRSARRMTPADYSKFDYILVMDTSNTWYMERIIGKDPEHKVSLMMSFAGEDKDVADPWYTGDFSKTYEDISRACEGLLEQILSKN